MSANSLVNNKNYELKIKISIIKLKKEKEKKKKSNLKLTEIKFIHLEKRERKKLTFLRLENGVHVFEACTYFGSERLLLLKKVMKLRVAVGVHGADRGRGRGRAQVSRG